jgi:hypothetical protein
MPAAPMPLKVILGLAAAAVDEARKLPESLPAAMTNVPVAAVTTAMHASLRLQQRLATLAARGEEVLSQLRGTSEDAPAWASFDDSPATPAEELPRAAFDLIDYAGTGFAEGDEAHKRWDAVGAGDDDVSDDLHPLPVSSGSPRKSPVKKSPVKSSPGQKSSDQKSPVKGSPVKSSPVKSSPVTKTSVKKTPAKRTSAKAVPRNAAGDLIDAAKLAVVAAASPSARKTAARHVPSSLADDLAAALEDSSQA